MKVYLVCINSKVTDVVAVCSSPASADDFITADINRFKDKFSIVVSRDEYRIEEWEVEE